MTRVSSVSFTYDGQNNADLITTTYTRTNSHISSTEPVFSTIPPPPPPSRLPPPNHHNVGAIIGGAIGGFVALSLIAFAIFWFVRRRKKDDTPPVQQLPSPMQVAPMEPAPSTGAAPIDPNAGKTGPNSPVQSEWRGSMMTVPSSVSNPASPQGWMNQPVSPSVQSAASQGVPQPIPQQHVAHEMSGDSVRPQVYEMSGDPVQPQVYEMIGAYAHPRV